MKDKVCSKSKKVMNTAKPMYEWNTLPWHQLDKQVFKLQKRIYQASERGEVKVVRRLQKLLISSWSAKAVAVRKVTQDNQGKKTAGVDGIKALTPYKRMKLVKNLQIEDKSKPTRRIWIPKPGKTEKADTTPCRRKAQDKGFSRMYAHQARPLEIPSIYERAKQALVKMALEPEWEAKFESNSYGFRPGRSCHDAIGAIHKSLAQKAKYILDADISKCFDKIDHQKLLEKINTSPTITRQIKAWFKSGVIDKGTLFPTKEGTPQGGVVSTLLANIALHGMEDLIRKSFPDRNGYKNGKYWSIPTPNLIRYAEDFVVLHKDIEVVRQCKSLIETWLKDIGLELKPEKTRISHSLEEYEGNTGFDFLGFHIQHYRAGKYKSGRSSQRKPLGHKLLIKPSKQSIKKHLTKIEDVIDKHRASKTEKVIGLLNPIIRGWCNYFRGVISSETFKLLDHLTYLKLRRWANKRHPNKGKKWVKSKYWKSIENRNWVFSETYKNEVTYTLINHSDTKIIRHVKVKGKKSPYDGDFVYWSQRLGTYPETSTRVRTLLKKEKGICTICKLSFTSQDILEVDHIKPRSQGGNDT
ncbi:reverse transcriptase domain-containing protein [Waterburya agarophytonicola]|uniref:reverse transcriptase domain-containing protein n=1 Tax=Waterburya agarophytonicola TaxID=2886916 RepID=UPI001E38FADD|nr:reverse transcriptase domain-containing protein [Waterburya agarophytonicola]